MNDEKMKLFVWHDVFSDHTEGKAFALAVDIDNAKECIIESIGNEVGSYFIKQRAMKELSEKAPEIIENPKGFLIEGH